MKRFKLYLLLSILINSYFINCSFQISLFNQLNKKNKNKNLNISPLSIFQALSLTTNGANGETQTELLQLLDNKQMEEINYINSNILSKIKENSSLEIANAIMSKLTPLPNFIQIAKDNYLSEIQPLNNVKQINKWCDNKTHGKIKKIIDKLESNVYMIILNAVYFKGKWNIPFSEDLTTKKAFYNFNSKNNEKKVDTMINTDYFSYFEDSNLQAIEFLFQKDDMSALIILPNDKLDINDFIDIIDKDNEYLYTIIDNFKDSKVYIEIPKFEIEYGESLKELLKDMGVNLAFNTNADFSKIRVQNDLLIDDVIHKTYIKVNEEGTEAAAFTAVEMLDMGAEPIEEEKIYNMVINRPFLFIIRNNKLPKNYDIIFISKVEELN